MDEPPARKSHRLALVPALSILRREQPEPRCTELHIDTVQVSADLLTPLTLKLEPTRTACRNDAVDPRDRKSKTDMPPTFAVALKLSVDPKAT